LPRAWPVVRLVGSASERRHRDKAQAAMEFGVDYTPIVNGKPSLFQGGAAFPGNDWTVSREGQDYLSRIPPQRHRALARIRAFHLEVTHEVLRKLAHGNDKRAIDEVTSFGCRSETGTDPKATQRLNVQPVIVSGGLRCQSGF